MSLGKIGAGVLATAALAWFLNGPMNFGEKCQGTGTSVPVANVTAPVGNVANVAAPAPAQTAETMACQTKVTDLMKGKVINFETGKAVIAASSQSVIDDVAGALKGCADAHVEVGGHTDKRGDDEMNKNLSEARAKAVVDALAAKGVDAKNMSAKGFGETVPLDPADTQEAYAKNRRIEFTVSAAAAPAAQPAG